MSAIICISLDKKIIFPELLDFIGQLRSTSRFKQLAGLILFNELRDSANPASEYRRSVHLALHD